MKFLSSITKQQSLRNRIAARILYLSGFNVTEHLNIKDKKECSGVEFTAGEIIVDERRGVTG